MKPGYAREKILIWAKTYPELSSKSISTGVPSAAPNTSELIVMQVDWYRIVGLIRWPLRPRLRSTQNDDDKKGCDRNRRESLPRSGGIRLKSLGVGCH